MYSAWGAVGFDSYPPYFLELRDVNRAGPVMHGPIPPPLVQLSVGEAETAVADGAQVVDVRQIEQFAAGHLPGALSIPWRTSFATWLGWLVPRERPVVFVADEHPARHDLVWAAATIGYDRLAGELAGGTHAWAAAGRDLATTRLLAPTDAAGRQVLDIRQRSEFAAGHVPGALHIELGQLSHATGDVPDGPLLVHCGHGERAMSAASVLERAGQRDVAVLVGGPDTLGVLEGDG